MTIIDAKTANEITKEHIDNPTPYEEYKSSGLCPLSLIGVSIGIEDMAKTGKYILPIRIPKSFTNIEAIYKGWILPFKECGYKIYKEEHEEDIVFNIDWSEPNDIM